ncbi:hypothetical protein CDAR_248151 [Caerostris darwini]|uniref:Uncharacterized protein n=1 Tax=Caerostris darwini TaxID=1538125 RepID=A0AAV4TMW8_9ARAC|nr:hypothetical protein CDAR_248151 [Caerostris darwini]
MGGQNCGLGGTRAGENKLMRRGRRFLSSKVSDGSLLSGMMNIEEAGSANIPSSLPPLSRHKKERGPFEIKVNVFVSDGRGKICPQTRRIDLINVAIALRQGGRVIMFWRRWEGQ